MVRDQIMPIKIKFWDLIYYFSSFESVSLILPLKWINDFCWIWFRIFYFHFYVGYYTFDWFFFWNELLTSVEYDVAYSNKTLHSIQLIIRDLSYSSNSAITLEGYMMLMTHLTSILFITFNLYYDVAFNCSSENISFS